jgi:hypothetical protein
VRHAQYLALLAELAQRSAHRIGHRTADAGVHFVEYQGRDRRDARRDQLDRQAEAR